jgi:hypothetical protein
VRGRPGLNHVLHGELPCDPEKVLGRSRGLEKRRRSELDGGGPAAAAGTRVLANGWLGLNNKQLGEVLWCTGKAEALGCVRKATGIWCSPSGGNGGRRRLGWKRVRARDGRGWLISVREGRLG